MTHTLRASERMHDGELLAAFCEAGAPWAFDELRQRHGSLVYSTARREVGDSDMAEDVAQAVFLLLIRKAPQMRSSRSIAGWLFQTARLTARNAKQQEARRQRREQEAQQMQHSQALEQRGAEEMWASIEPFLHDALGALSDKERQAVLLRLFENRPAPEVARLLGISPNAAQMRVSRGVEKMRRFLLKRGLPITSAALAAMLSEEAVQAAPLALVAAPVGASMAAVATPELIQGVMQMMKINAWKTMALRLGVAAIVAGGVCGAVALQRNTNAVANEEALPLPSPDSPAVGTWRRSAGHGYTLSPDGTGQEMLGRRQIKVAPVRWHEQDGAVTLDFSEEMSRGYYIRYIGHLSSDKRTLNLTKSKLIMVRGSNLSYEGVALNWVFAKQ